MKRFIAWVGPYTGRANFSSVPPTLHLTALHPQLGVVLRILQFFTRVIFLIKLSLTELLMRWYLLSFGVRLPVFLECPKI